MTSKPDTTVDLSLTASNVYQPLDDEEEDERYLVLSRSQILDILTRLGEHGSLVTAYFNEGRDFILSSVLAVHGATNVLILDFGPDERLNLRMSEAQRVVFVTELDRIRIQFRSDRVEPILYGERKAFELMVPERLTRLQRREFFRISPPLNQPVTAEFVHKVGDRATRMLARGLDISCGGVALMIEADLQGIEKGTIFRGVDLELPEQESIMVDLEVGDVLFQKLPSGRSVTRIGCRFLSLQATLSARIQRYITKLEVLRAQRR